MHDLLYLEDGKVKLSESAQQIQEFIDFKRYDRSDDKVFFWKAMNYIYYVYKVFGADGEAVSYLHNLPLSQRKVLAVQSHCSPYTLHQMEENKWVQGCVNAYLLYSRTQNERLLDAFKDDLAKYIAYVETIPLELMGKAKVKGINPNTGDYEDMLVEVPVPNIQPRLDALKSAHEYRKMYLEWEKLAQKDMKVKRSQARLFEDEKVVKTINIDGIPSAKS